MKIEVPINNTVEVVVADLYVNVECKLLPSSPIEKTEAKLALEQVEVKINHIFTEAVYKAKRELDSLLS